MSCLLFVPISLSHFSRFFFTACSLHFRRSITEHGLCPPVGFQQKGRLKVQKWGFRGVQGQGSGVLGLGCRILGWELVVGFNFGFANVTWGSIVTLSRKKNAQNM